MQRGERLQTQGENGDKYHEHEYAHLDLGWLNFFQIRSIRQTGGQAGRPSVVIIYLNIYLQKGYDKRSQREVGGFLELGVKFLDG